MHNLVIVATFRTRIEAEIAQSYLKAQKVGSFIQADDFGGLARPFTNVPGVNLLVKKEDYEKAKTLLDIE